MEDEGDEPQHETTLIRHNRQGYSGLPRQSAPPIEVGASDLGQGLHHGYGGRSLDEFLSLLSHYRISILVDVRRWSSSKKNPSFSAPALDEAAKRVGIEYRWMSVLGGFRRFGVDVEDLGIAHCFESKGFRAYATYIVAREEVKRVLDDLAREALAKTIALMCAERYPWNCHRKILSDYFLARGFQVFHIIDEKTLLEHRLSKCAKVKNGELWYV